MLNFVKMIFECSTNTSASLPRGRVPKAGEGIIKLFFNQPPPEFKAERKPDEDGYHVGWSKFSFLNVYNTLSPPPPPREGTKAVRFMQLNKPHPNPHFIGTTVRDNFNKIKIVNKKLDCFRLIAFAMTARLEVSRHVIARSASDEAIHKNIEISSAPTRISKFRTAQL